MCRVVVGNATEGEYAGDTETQGLEGHQGQEDDDKHLQHPGLKPHGLQQIVNGFW
jgi:hypothetical protein